MKRFSPGTLSVTFSVLLLIAAHGCANPPPPTTPKTETGPAYTAFRNSERVTLRGYDGDAMEPFLTRDGHYLIFNSSNDPRVNTNIHYAERVDDLTFDYRGEVSGVNTSALEGVPSMDREGNFYFISMRSYRQTLSTIYRGNWFDGRVLRVRLVPGVSEKVLGSLNFDAEINASGTRLYFVDGMFGGGPLPQTADIAVAVSDGDGFRRLARSEGIFARVNTDKLEYAPATSADELELFFTRLNPVTNEIGLYRAARSRITEAFGEPARVVAADGFVEAPTLSPDGKSLYYHKKDGARYVIYRITR